MKILCHKCRSATAKSVYEVLLIKIFIILIVLLHSPSYADLYFWTDENGVKHFSNTQPADAPDAKRRPEIRSNNDFVHQHKDNVHLQSDSVESFKMVTKPRINIELNHYVVKSQRRWTPKTGQCVKLRVRPTF